MIFFLICSLIFLNQDEIGIFLILAYFIVHNRFCLGYFWVSRIDIKQSYVQI